MLHEFGHAFYNALPKIYDRDTSDAYALTIENAYRRFIGVPQREDHGPPPSGFFHP